MKKLFLLLCTLLAGCATGTMMQAECESKHSQFPDIYRCTYDSIAQRSPHILQDGRAKLYLLRGEQLAQEVTEGRMSSLDAKVLWQQLFVQMKSAKDAESLAATDAVSRYLMATRAARPAPSQTVNCSSTKIGNTVDTTCR